jgi:phytoene/squalene synthetase
MDELRSFGCRRTIFLKAHDAGVRELMKFQVHRPHSYYEAAQNGIRLLEPNAIAIHSASRIYRAFSKIQRATTIFS